MAPESQEINATQEMCPLYSYTRLVRKDFFLFLLNCLISVIIKTDTELLQKNREKVREVLLDSGASTQSILNRFIGPVHLQAGQAQVPGNSDPGFRKEVCQKKRLLSMLGHMDDPKIF